METVRIEPTWAAFRVAARRLLADQVGPDRVTWVEEGGPAAQLSLLQGGRGDVASPCEPPPPGTDPGRARVPARFLGLGEVVACHRETPWPILYRALWRLAAGEARLLADAADPLVARLLSMERAVKRDSHKMKAFVRFRAMDVAGAGNGPGPVGPDGRVPSAATETRYAAWFEPRHRIVRRTAPFFRRRFPSMRWSVLTPDECAHWDGAALTFTAGVDRSAAPDTDDLEALWLSYYTHTFNPARVRTRAMRAEMPVHYWRNLPEARAIPGLVREAPVRVRDMVERASIAVPGAPPRAASEREAGTAPPALGVRATLRATARASEPSGSVAHAPGPTGPGPVRVPHVRVGVAGWDYPDWAGRVYPEGRAGVDRLRWVASRFDLIEVNSTFYRPPSPRATRRWLERTADRPELRFSAKLYRGFTHRRGAWREADVAAVEAGLRPVLDAGRLSTLLVQLPWSFKARPDEKRWLRRLLDAFAGFPLHVEVRHDSWDTVAFRDWLRGRGVGLACIDQPLFPRSIAPSAHATSRLAYIRLHGRNVENWFREGASRDERYDYRYTRSELEPWAERVAGLVGRADVDEVQVVFNNHYRAQAVHDAEAFARMLGQAAPG